MTQIAKSSWLWWIVATLGLLVIAGWLARCPVMMSVHSEFVTMKFATATAFLFTGIAGVLHSLPSQFRSETSRYIGHSFSILVIMICSFSAGTSSDGLIESIDKPLFSAGNGVPSVMTVVCFTILNLLMVFEVRKSLYRQVATAGVAVIGAIAIAGYVLWVPMLFYYMDGVSSAMAIHTAAGFIICSVASDIHSGRGA